MEWVVNSSEIQLIQYNTALPGEGRFHKVCSVIEHTSWNLPSHCVCELPISELSLESTVCRCMMQEILLHVRVDVVTCMVTTYST